MLQLYRIYIDYIKHDQLYKTPHFMDQMFFADVSAQQTSKIGSK